MTAPDRPVRYELKSVKALRGTEGRSIAKWQNDGWELVDQNASTLYTTLNFRKVKRDVPWRLLALLGGIVLFLVLTGSIASALGGGDEKGADVAKPAPAASSEPLEDPSPEPEVTDSATPTAEPTQPPAQAIDISVDALLDKLNSANMGGIKLGDRFEVTGELSGSEYWGTGVTGDYIVNLKAKGGAQDLPFFVKESDAAGWRDGTRVELVLENVERTINSETDDGNLLARTVKTLRL